MKKPGLQHKAAVNGNHKGSLIAGVSQVPSQLLGLSPDSSHKQVMTDFTLSPTLLCLRCLDQVSTATSTTKRVLLYGYREQAIINTSLHITIHTKQLDNCSDHFCITQ